VLRCAVEWGRIPANPARHVRKPPQRRSRAIRPLAPATVEALRAWVGAHGAHRDPLLRHRDATLLSLLAYSGVRPGEARALTWADVRERTLLIERAVAPDGGLKPTKTRHTRTVRLLAPLARDLAEWRLACGRPHDRTLLFPAGGGAPWPNHDWQNWRRRIFQPAASAVGLDRAVPYDLRHTFCSLLLGEGQTVIEVAAQLGHAPSMTTDTYGHVIQELAGQRVPAEEQIRRARAQVHAAAAGR
jgi:integrase